MQYETTYLEKAHADCPIVQMIGLLSGRWALPVLFQLNVADRPMRFGELRRSLGRVTQKELTRTLREFEARGLISRQIFPEIPPRVEYAVTPLGKTLREPLSGLASWIHAYGDQIVLPKPGVEAVPTVE